MEENRVSLDCEVVSTDPLRRSSTNLTLCDHPSE